MRMKMNRTIVVILMLAVLVGCGVRDQDLDSGTSNLAPAIMTRLDGARYIWRVIDLEAGVVCYDGGEALVCMPIGETSLRVGE